MSYIISSSIARSNEQSYLASCVEENTRENVIASSFSEHSFLTISYQDFKLGITFYCLGATTFQLLHEVYEYYDFSYTKNILQKVEPSHVIISSKCDINMVNFVKCFAVNSNEFSSDSENAIDNSLETNISEYFAYDDYQANPIYLQFQLHVMPNRHFHYEQCKTRILSMNLPEMENMIDSKQRFIFLTSKIDFSEINTIKSLGVMLQFIEKNLHLFKLSPHIENDIANFEYLNIYHVTMDQTTFEALEIFQQEWHPSTSKKGFYKKEGLSLFGLFNTCSSKVGSFRLKKMFQQPITDYDLLLERYDTIEYFMNPVNKSLKSNLTEHLKNLKDIIPALKRLEASNFLLSDLETLSNVVHSMVAIRNLTSKTDLKLMLFSQITKILTKELEELSDCLNMTINFPLSKANKCIEIENNVNDQLDELRLIFNKLPKILEKIMFEDTEEEKLLALNLAHISNAYVPQIGFLFNVPLSHVQDISDLGMDLIFCANNRAFHKNIKTTEFDRHYGDIQSNIYDFSQKELIRLKTYILNRKKVLKSSISICAYLDSMITMAHTAINYKYVRPNLTIKGVIKIEDGRHPICELISNSFTANSFFSNNDESKISIIFGPNSSGKSIFLKQVSLIVYLAHIGSYVPAKYAEITIVDQIYTRIRTPESISTQLSSFKHDLNQIIMATNYASFRSLVVIDFFGKGTLSIDGYSLLAAFVNHWIKAYDRPHLIISSLFNIMSSLCQSSDIKFYTFQSLFGQSTSKANLSSFNLVECHNQEHHDENMLNPVQLANANNSKMEKLFHTDNVSIDLKDTHPELDDKFQKYIEIAEYIINEFECDGILAKISLLIQSFTNKDNIK